jgi:hypothetical protein
MEVSGQLYNPAALHTGKEPLVPIGWEAGWDPESFWTRWWREKFPAPAGNRTLEPRSSGPYPALYRLSYHGSPYVSVVIVKLHWNGEKRWHLTRPPTRCQQFIRPLTHSLSHSHVSSQLLTLIHSLILSFKHSLADIPIHLFIRSLTRT